MVGRSWMQQIPNPRIISQLWIIWHWCTKVNLTSNGFKHFYKNVLLWGCLVVKVGDVCLKSCAKKIIRGWMSYNGKSWFWITKGPTCLQKFWFFLECIRKDKISLPPNEPSKHTQEVTVYMKYARGSRKSEWSFQKLCLFQQF